MDVFIWELFRSSIIITLLSFFGYLWYLGYLLCKIFTEEPENRAKAVFLGGITLAGSVATLAALLAIVTV